MRCHLRQNGKDMGAASARDDFMRRPRDDLEAEARVQAVQRLGREEIHMLVPMPFQRCWTSATQSHQIFMRNLDIEPRLGPHGGDEFGQYGAQGQAHVRAPGSER